MPTMQGGRRMDGKLSTRMDPAVVWSRAMERTFISWRRLLGYRSCRYFRLMAPVCDSLSTIPKQRHPHCGNLESTELACILFCRPVPSIPSSHSADDAVLGSTE